MTKTPEQEANELVEMFREPCVTYEWDSGGYKVDELTTIQCQTIASILHVERLIEVLSKRCSLGGYTRDQIEHYQQVLSILKDKN